MLNVVDGQCVARVHQRNERLPGINLKGELYFHDNKAKKCQDIIVLQASEGVCFDEESQRYFATCSGVLNIEDNKISVKEKYVVHGDVDYSTGHIDVLGSLEIEGSILDGFTVKAGDDILVHGSVGAATVVSHKGNIKVDRGVAGKNRCHLSAKKDVECKYIENGTIFAGGDIHVHEAILNSRINAEGQVFSIEGRGRISGGIISAGKNIHAKVLGAPNEPKTLFRLIFNTMYREQYESLELYLVKIRNSLTQNEEEITCLKKNDQNKLLELKKKNLVLRHYEQEQIKKIKEFESKMIIPGECEVHVSDTAYPKVHIQMGIHQYLVQKKMGASVFWYDKKNNQVSLNSKGGHCVT